MALVFLTKKGGGRLSLTKDGRIAYERKYKSEGASHVVMTPTELLARLSSLVFPPRHPILRYHGGFAANHKLREKIVPASPPEQRTEAANPEKPRRGCIEDSAAAAFIRSYLLQSTATTIDFETPSSKLTPQKLDLLSIDCVAFGAKDVEACGAKEILVFSEPLTTARADGPIGHDAPAQRIVAPPLRGRNTERSGNASKEAKDTMALRSRAEGARGGLGFEVFDRPEWRVEDVAISQLAVMASEAEGRRYAALVMLGVDALRAEGLPLRSSRRSRRRGALEIMADVLYWVWRKPDPRARELRRTAESLGPVYWKAKKAKSVHRTKPGSMPIERGASERPFIWIPGRPPLARGRNF